MNQESPPVNQSSASTSSSPTVQNSQQAVVGVIMGSKSDWDTMQHCCDMLKQLTIPFETRIVSAHRTPQQMIDYASTAAERGLEIIIAGAGGAAHLPGMTASMTHLPVVGVPVASKMLNGVDSLLSIVQMPAGVPVATVAIGKAGAINAALLAASMLAGRYPQIAATFKRFRLDQTQAVLADALTDLPSSGK